MLPAEGILLNIVASHTCAGEYSSAKLEFRLGNPVAGYPALKVLHLFTLCHYLEYVPANWFAKCMNPAPHALHHRRSQSHLFSQASIKAI